MLSKLMYFLEGLHSVRSLISVIVLIAGIVLIIVWKVKRKNVSVLICSIVLITVPVIVIAHGCYSAYLRPESMEIGLTEQEIKDFSEYLLENDRFLDTKSFLTNNIKSFYEAENGKKYLYDETMYYYDSTQQGVTYKPNSDIIYYLHTYKDAKTAENIYKDEYLPDVNNKTATENKIYIKGDDYSVYAGRNFKSTFFDLRQGEHNITDLTFVILHENYIILISEVTESHTPKLCSLIKEEKLFDRGYKLKTWVEA